jgi:Na+-transporting NADH:ubiquinone oxidoreductase subunit C
MNKKSPAYVMGFMVVVAAVFGLGVALVHNITLPTMKRNEQLHRNRSIAMAFDIAAGATTAQHYEKAVSEAIQEQTISHNGKQWTAFVKKDGSGSIGFIFEGIGFWDMISGIMVLSHDLSTIQNIQFLGQKETPGLGARIEEKSFTDRFRGKAVAWENQPEQRFIIGAYPPEAPNRVDAITGATQTSLALMKTLNHALGQFREAWMAQGSTSIQSGGN